MFVWKEVYFWKLGLSFCGSLLCCGLFLCSSFSLGSSLGLCFRSSLSSLLVGYFLSDLFIGLLLGFECGSSSGLLVSSDLILNSLQAFLTVSLPSVELMR